jgi:hypothetical protein
MVIKEQYGKMEDEMMDKESDSESEEEEEEESDSEEMHHSDDEDDIEGASKAEEAEEANSSAEVEANSAAHHPRPPPIMVYPLNKATWPEVLRSYINQRVVHVASQIEANREKMSLWSDFRLTRDLSEEELADFRFPEESTSAPKTQEMVELESIAAQLTEHSYTCTSPARSALCVLHSSVRGCCATHLFCTLFARLRSPYYSSKGPSDHVLDRRGRCISSCSVFRVHVE